MTDATTTVPGFEISCPFRLPDPPAAAKTAFDLREPCPWRGTWSGYLEHAVIHELPHPDSRDEWLHARRTFIGASEIAAVCGMSPWATALDVWASKVRPEERTMPPAARIGLMLERPLLEDYAARHSVEIERPATRRHPRFAFLGASPDGDVVGAELVQVKVVGVRVAHQWEDGPPRHVIMQVQQEMEVWDRPRAVVLALIGSELREHVIERDPELFAGAIELAGAFWREAVVPAKLPTDFDGAPTDDTLRRLFPRMVNAGLLPADAEVIDLATRYSIAQRTVTEAEGVKDAIKGRLKAIIGEGEGFAWGPLAKPAGKVTWTNNRPSLDKGALIEEVLAAFTPAERERLVAKFTPEDGTRVLRVTVK